MYLFMSFIVEASDPNREDKAPTTFSSLPNRRSVALESCRHGLSVCCPLSLSSSESRSHDLLYSINSNMAFPHPTLWVYGVCGTVTIK